MFCLNFFMKLYFMDYAKNVVIPDTNKRLNSAIQLSEFFCVVGCRLIMDYYVCESVRELLLKNIITPNKGAPMHLNHIISGRSLAQITQGMSYKNLAINEFNELNCFAIWYGRWLRKNLTKRQRLGVLM